MKRCIIYSWATHLHVKRLNKVYIYSVHSSLRNIFLINNQENLTMDSCLKLTLVPWYHGCSGTRQGLECTASFLKVQIVSHAYRSLEPTLTLSDRSVFRINLDIASKSHIHETKPPVHWNSAFPSCRSV